MFFRIDSRFAGDNTPSLINSFSNRAIGSFFFHSANNFFGTYQALSCAACPCILIVTDSIIVGPSPLRPLAAASFPTRYTSITSVPSTVIPGIPYPTARLESLSTMNCFEVGVEYANWLFSMIRISGSRMTEAIQSASCTSPMLAPPSPI